MKSGALIAGKFRLVRPIGRGAMGEVWEATHEGTSRQVAIKLILEPTDELRIRLIREAQAYGMLRHRNIVEILDVGQTDEGDPFLVMQLLLGETLADRLTRQRRLGVPEAARIARDVARALAVAHTASIIHRDLKPANIFLHDEPDEEIAVVKVVDFGVSKNLLASDGLSTVAGGMVGSPAYMSPEQAAAGTRGPVDHRADLWSLGVVLFEMLTGVRPLQGDAVSIIPQIVSAEIPLVTTFVRSIDPRLAALVARCLDRDLAKRVGSAAELATLLQPFTTANQGSGTFSLGQSGSGLNTPFAPPARSDATVLVSPRAPFASVPEREPSGAGMAPPRASFGSISDRDSSARSPRPQGGRITAGPSMPGMGNDEEEATAKLELGMLHRPGPGVPPAAPSQRRTGPGVTEQLQSDPAMQAYRPPMPSQNQPPPAPQSLRTTQRIEDKASFGSGANWPAPPPPTAMIDPGSAWGAQASVTNQGTVRILPEEMEKIRSAVGAAQLAAPPAPPPPNPSSVSSTSSLIQQSSANLSSPSQAGEQQQQQKRLRTTLLVSGTVVGVALAVLAVVMIRPSGDGAKSAATEGASVATAAPQVPSATAPPSAAQVAEPPPSAEPAAAPPSAAPSAAAPPSAVPSGPVPAPPIAAGTPSSRKPAPGPMPTAISKPPTGSAPAGKGKLPGFLSKKTNPSGI